jgi:hypothetical protein
MLVENRNVQASRHIECDRLGRRHAHGLRACVIFQVFVGGACAGVETPAHLFVIPGLGQAEVPRLPGLKGETWGTRLFERNGDEGAGHGILLDPGARGPGCRRLPGNYDHLVRRADFDLRARAPIERRRSQGTDFQAIP